MINAELFPFFLYKKSKTLDINIYYWRNIYSWNYVLDCNEGYYGHDSISPCRYPNFGKKCQNMCSCQLFDCYHIKGCKNITGTCKKKNLNSK